MYTERCTTASVWCHGCTVADHGMNAETLEGCTVSTPTGDVELGDLLGTGAEGAVFRVRDTPTDVVKVFTPAKRTDKADKVAAMIANPPTDPTLVQRGVQSIIWPTGIVEDPETRSFLGYTMPYVDLSQYKNAQRYAASDLRWDETPETQRYKTALNLASVVDAIHQQDHAIGDMNHQNILINDGYVSLIDCDAFHIHEGGVVSPGRMFFPRYTPPEGRGSTIDDVRDADRFGLAVHIFQLLMEGFHPFQAHGSQAAKGDFNQMIQQNPFPYGNSAPDGIEPHPRAPPYDRLPAAIRDQFSDCFAWGKTHQRGRPSPAEWIQTLRQVSGISDPEEAGTTGTEADAGAPSETPTTSEPDYWTDEYRPDPLDDEDPFSSSVSRGGLLSFDIRLTSPLTSLTTTSVSERLMRIAYYITVFFLCFLVFYIVLTALG